MLRTYEEQSGELDLSSLLYILAGQWGAAAVVSDRPPHHERSRGFYVRILDDMLTAIRSSPHSVDACDPALVLLGEGILRRFGLRVPHFELLARNSANALLGYESPVDHGLNLFPVTHLLESLGFELKARSGDRETDVAMI